MEPGPATISGGVAERHYYSSSAITLLLLPRELREWVYQYLWDEETVQNILASQAPAPDCFPGAHVSFGVRRPPWFLNPRYLGQEVTEEIAESFYRHYTGFEAKSARHVDALLKHDFFKLDMRLCDHALSALTICIHLDEADPNYVRNADLHRLLQPLVDLPALIRNFGLTIRLRSRYSAEVFACICAPDEGCLLRKKNVEFVEKVADALKAVENFAYNFGLEKSRSVALRLELDGSEGPFNRRWACGVMQLTLEDIDNDEEEWLVRLKELTKRL